jgi:hypothetical protein
MNATRSGRRAAQDAAFKFTGHAAETRVREAAEFAAAVYQPSLRVLLATLGRDDVLRVLVAIGALRVLGGAV